MNKLLQYGFIATAVLTNILGTALPEGPPPNYDAFKSDWPVGDPRRCQDKSRHSHLDVQRFEVLPGVGWDNLRNAIAGQVISYNFTQCKVTDDGNFLIPDNLFTVPLKTSRVETFAEMIETWHNSSSLTANTVNIETGMSFGFVSVSGKFSYEHEELKSKQIEDKAVTVRVQIRYNRYEAKLQPDPVLSPQFRSRLLNIAARLEMNQTEQARYEGQLLVRDFGTHVLTSVTAGAGLVKDDYLKSDFVSSSRESKTSILVSASASFLGIFHMSASYGHKTDDKVSDSYNKSLTHSVIRTLGGPLYRIGNMTLDEWTEGVDKNVVPMDRAGDPLYFLVTPQTLPEVTPTTVYEVEKIVRESIELYYEMNTYRGCTKLGSPNFSFSANFDDGSCTARPTNVSFGGVYQTCAVYGLKYFKQKNPCEKLIQVNPKTGSYSCPQSYMPVLLQTGSIKSLSSCRIVFNPFHCTMQYGEAVYSTYWCAATGQIEPDSGYLFGGLYQITHVNPVTGTESCPPTFYAIRILSDLTICISDDFEQSSGMAVPFGGFFSCKAGNVLSAERLNSVGFHENLAAKNSLKVFMAGKVDASEHYPMRCPEGYSQHLATVDEGCSIHYCIQAGTLAGPNLPPIRRPPYMTRPASQIENEYNLFIFDPETQTWRKNNKAYNNEVVVGLTPGIIAVITVCAAVASAGVVAVIILGVKLRRARGSSKYTRIIGESNYGAVDEAFNDEWE
ncbi:macrophage-expressed 1 protein-like isoform X1 [Biomphalaria pfeifferi]|uniref:Macrophage-expressed 1 protein-like isoform X1 n=1 Tax=Biomphalaria pfeifferi TaxID=112525 RepID=A0AAD8B102_BIOPF|nr:macrophage-expressed 1 protein-like isoform X1 [Biomphalaria pfeifferi]